MKRLIPSFVALILLGCGGDPEFQGQPLSNWIGALDNPDPGMQAVASQVLVDAAYQDKSVVPHLVAAAKRGSYGAIDTLAKIGPGVGDEMKNVIAALSDALNNKKNLSGRLAAARALPKFGPPAKAATPGLIELLKDPDPIARVQAAETLGKIADPGPEIAAALVEATRDPLLNVKHTAMDALQNVDPKAYEKIRDHR